MGEEIDAGEGFDGVDGEGVLIEFLFAGLVGDDEAEHRLWLGYVDDFIEVAGNGDVVGADGAMIVAEDRAGDDVDGVEGGCDLADVVFEFVPDATVEGLILG